MSAIIYHNPDCATSRNVLSILMATGKSVEVIEYLKVGWDRDTLLALFKAANLTPRRALRETKSPAAELGLLDPSVEDESLIEAMLKHPVLVNRPIVVTSRGTRLCRPSETVLDLLDALPKGPLYKEDGQMLIDENGARLGA